MSTTSKYAVTGMTCAHCVSSVTEEISEIDGVRSVGVDLESGVVTVTSDIEIADDRIRDAVEEAGYELA